MMLADGFLDRIRARRQRPVAAALQRAAHQLDVSIRDRRREDAKRSGDAASDVPDQYHEWMRERRLTTSEGQPARWDYRHFEYWGETLDEVTAGELLRVVVNAAIRHGKTEYMTIGYAAYRIIRDPTTRVIVGSYNQRQARKLSRAIKAIVRANGVDISPERDAQDEWETVAGGSVRAVGAGTGTASMNADLIFIDDPIGSRKEAESLAHRNQVWDWITNDILSRCEPHTAVIFSMPRWHVDDPAGRMRVHQADRWRFIDMPVRAESDDDVLGRGKGELLWPELRTDEWLRFMETDLASAYAVAALLYCRPRPREGGMFKFDWWTQSTDGKPLAELPKCVRWIRYWDTAGSEPRKGKTEPDYTSGTLAGRMADGRTVLAHQAAFQKGVAARDAKMREVAKSDRKNFPGVAWWIEREVGIGGTERTNALVRMIQALGIPCYTEGATGSKGLRAEPLQSAAEAGNVLLGPDDPEEPWHDSFRLEACDFTGSGDDLHDDRVDSTAGAYNKLSDPRGGRSRTFRMPR